MKFRPILLLFGAALLAAVPVCADGIHQPEIGEQGARNLLFDGFNSHKMLNFLDSKSFPKPDTFISATSDTDFHAGRLTDLNFREGASATSYLVTNWSRENLDMDSYEHGVGGHVPTQIPEPGSLWLSLLGMAAVGFFPRGRAKWARSN